ncbi:MerR family transcriptional regulator [Peribacillus simplex]|uniref:MerR family transcriptional regulator n=1 Tax=Peribacillus simplex TaxID=1478 RepID=UPI003D29D6DE
MSEHFSIGETARLNNISIQTLRYYDKLGIFKPDYTDPDNGYRYYHINQFFYLDIIKYLKSIQTPLDEIKYIILNTPQDMRTFLEEQEDVIEAELKKLEGARLLLKKRKGQLKEQLEICGKDRGTVYFRKISKQRILKVATPSLNPHNGPGLYVRQLASVLEEKGCMIDNQYGYIFSLKPYDNKDIIYEHIYTSVSHEYQLNIEEPVRLDHILSGEYICIAFDWSANNKNQNYYYYYRTLYDYIILNNIKTDGIVYEVSLPTSYSSVREETFLTELRVKKTD